MFDDDKKRGDKSDNTHGQGQQQFSYTEMLNASPIRRQSLRAEQAKKLHANSPSRKQRTPAEIASGIDAKYVKSDELTNDLKLTDDFTNTLNQVVNRYYSPDYRDILNQGADSNVSKSKKVLQQEKKDFEQKEKVVFEFLVKLADARHPWTPVEKIFFDEYKKQNESIAKEIRAKVEKEKMSPELQGKEFDPVKFNEEVKTKNHFQSEAINQYLSREGGTSFGSRWTFSKLEKEVLGDKAGERTFFKQRYKNIEEKINIYHEYINKLKANNIPLTDAQKNFDSDKKMAVEQRDTAKHEASKKKHFSNFFGDAEVKTGPVSSYNADSSPTANQKRSAVQIGGARNK